MISIVKKLLTCVWVGVGLGGLDLSISKILAVTLEGYWHH